MELTTSGGFATVCAPADSRWPKAGGAGEGRMIGPAMGSGCGAALIPPKCTNGEPVTVSGDTECGERTKGEVGVF